MYLMHYRLLRDINLCGLHSQEENPVKVGLQPVSVEGSQRGLSELFLTKSASSAVSSSTCIIRGPPELADFCLKKANLGVSVIFLLSIADLNN